MMLVLFSLLALSSSTPPPTALSAVLQSQYGINNPSFTSALDRFLRMRLPPPSPSSSSSSFSIEDGADVEVELSIDGQTRLFVMRDPGRRSRGDVTSAAAEFCRAHEVESAAECAASLTNAVLDEEIDARVRGDGSGRGVWLRAALEEATLRAVAAAQPFDTALTSATASSPARSFRATGPLPLHLLPFFEAYTEFGERYEDKFEDSRFGGTGDIVWSREVVNELLEQARARVDMNHRAYPNAVPDFYEAFTRFPVRGKRLLVAGSEMPWIEAIAVAFDAALVVTSEYQNLKSKSPLIQTIKTDVLMRRPLPPGKVCKKS